MGEIKTLLEFYAEHGAITITIPLTLWVLWAGYNWRIFHKTNGDQYDEACQRRLNWLKQDHWSALYKNWLGVLLDKVSTVIGDAGQGNDNWISRKLCHRFGFDHNPWTEPSFNLLLRIALVYPLLSFIVFWLMGGSGMVGGVELLPDNAGLSEFQRWGLCIALFLGLFGLFYLMRWLRALSGWRAVLALVLAVFLILLISHRDIGEATFLSGFVLGLVFLSVLLGATPSYGVSWLFLRNRTKAVGQVRTALWDIAVAGAGAGAFVYAGAVTGAGAGTFTVAGTVAVTFAFAGAGVFAIALAGAFAVAVAVVFAVDFAVVGVFAVAVVGTIFYQNIQIRGRASGFWLVYLLLMLWVVFFAIQNVSSHACILFLFWLIFPLLNVPLDWLSLGVTRGLLQSIRSGRHLGRRVFVWVLADLVIAFILLLLMAAILIVAIKFANELRLDIGKDMVLDLAALLHGMENNPSNPGFYWIYFMLFSTLLPTLVHFALAGASVLLWFPEKRRHALLANWQHDADKKFGIWLYVSIMPVLGFIIAPAGLLYGLWCLLGSFDFGLHLINLFQEFV